MPDHAGTTDMKMESLNVERLVEQLATAWETRTPVAPLSETSGVTSSEVAYAIQTRWTERRLATGERIIGRKIGLTSRAMQEQMGVNEPDYGSLWASRYFPARRGRVEVPADLFLQPRIEGEVAFLIGRRLAGPGVSLQAVLAATDAAALAVEIVDSRIKDWRITLPDTVADNASYGGFTVGSWSRSLREADLRTVGMLLSHQGKPVVQGIGAAVLGHPARAVAWLANKLGEFGITLEPGDIVLSGSLGQAVPVQQGDICLVEMFDQPPITLKFT